MSLAVLIDRGLDLHLWGVVSPLPSLLPLFSSQGFDPEEKVGADGGGGTPVPIPNTAVKPTCAHDTWLVAARENRQAPTLPPIGFYDRLGVLFFPIPWRLLCPPSFSTPFFLFSVHLWEVPNAYACVYAGLTEEMRILLGREGFAQGMKDAGQAEARREYEKEGEELADRSEGTCRAPLCFVLGF